MDQSGFKLSESAASRNKRRWELPVTCGLAWWVKITTRLCTWTPARLFVNVKSSATGSDIIFWRHKVRDSLFLLYFKQFLLCFHFLHINNNRKRTQGPLWQLLQLFVAANHISVHVWGIFLSSSWHKSFVRFLYCPVTIALFERYTQIFNHVYKFRRLKATTNPSARTSGVVQCGLCDLSGIITHLKKTSSLFSDFL